MKIRQYEYNNEQTGDIELMNKDNRQVVAVGEGVPCYNTAHNKVHPGPVLGPTYGALVLTGYLQLT